MKETMAFQYQGKPGPGRFQWSRGAWFGAQVGATIWLILLGVLMLGQGRAAGATVLVLGLATNGLGVWLWRARQEREPYPSIQIFLGACAVVAVVSVLVAGASDRAAPTGTTTFTPSLPVLLVYPVLMALLHFQEHRDRTARDSSGADTPTPSAPAPSEPPAAGPSD
jgi:hypothetical protein